MKAILTFPPIAAILYDEGRRVDCTMRMVVDYLINQGLTIAGFLQRDMPRAGRRRCDMVLEELASGELIGISQDRGPQARGCMLDIDELLRAEARAMAALATRPHLVAVNKFGKTEAEGGGFRQLIAAAMSSDIPVLTTVPRRNLEAWRAFVGSLAIEFEADHLPADAASACAKLGLAAEMSCAPRQPNAGATALRAFS